MSIIVNTNSREEYNNKINYYQINGFKIQGTSTNNLQTRLEKKNFGPVWVHILLILSLLGSLFYLSDLVLYPLAISDLFVRLNLFSLILAVQYLQAIGIILLLILIAMIILLLYYYMTKPYEVIIRLNQNSNQLNNNINNYRNYGGN